MRCLAPSYGHVDVAIDHLELAQHPEWHVPDVTPAPGQRSGDLTGPTAGGQRGIRAPSGPGRTVTA